MLRRVVTLIALLSLLACHASRHTGKLAPDFTLSDSTGTPVQLSAYKGKVVLLDFWETYCGGCRTEIPWYMEFQKKYQSDGFTTIGVSLDDDGWKSVRPFLQQSPINYPIVIGNDQLVKLYGGFNAMPVTLLIDRSGRIADYHVGVVDKAQFEDHIRSLLRNKPENI